MDERSRPLLLALAAILFAAMASSHLLLGRLLHYASLEPTFQRIALMPVVVVAALLHEYLVRGSIYDALRGRLDTGLAAPLVALCGTLVPVSARFLLVTPTGGPLLLLVVQAFIVEWLLGLGLCWIALGGRRAFLASALALTLVWIVRLSILATFHGGAVPVLEVGAAFLATASVALALWKPLARHREELLGLSA